MHSVVMLLKRAQSSVVHSHAVVVSADIAVGIVNLCLKPSNIQLIVRSRDEQFGGETRVGIISNKNNVLFL